MCIRDRNLGYQAVRELGPGEIAVVTPEGVRTLVQPGKDMKICTFLWVYYGYPSSSYEGISVEKMRYQCGAKLAERDHVKPDKMCIRDRFRADGSFRENG